MAKERITVGTQIVRAIEDDKIPSSVKTGVTKSLLQDGDLVDYVTEELLGCIGVRADRMYEYARKGTYVHGLPSGRYTNPAGEAVAAVTAVLHSLSGTAVTVDYLHWGVPNNLHTGWVMLQAVHGYDPETNQLGVLSATYDTEVYLENMVVVVPKADLATTSRKSLEQWGPAARSGYTPTRDLTPGMKNTLGPSEVEASESAFYEHVRVEYMWLDEDEKVQKDSFTIPTNGLNSQKNYFHVRYFAGGVPKWWMYEDGSGTWPSLDYVYDKPVGDSGSFFPFIYFRYNKKSETDNKTTLSYKGGKKLTKYLGMNFDDIAEAINSNPDITDVEQAMLMFAVPAVPETQIEKRYVFEFFNSLYLSQSSGDQLKAPLVGALVDTTPGRVTTIENVAPGMVIQDRRFKMTLRNSGIYKRKVAGKLGPIGTYYAGYNAFSTDKFVPIVDAETGEPVATLDVYTKHHYYRRQITKTIYEEILVVGLQTQFDIFETWHTIGDEDDDILIIPVDHAISKTYSIAEREELYSRAAHFVFNSRIVTKVKWYQTGLFKAVLIIIAILIIVFSKGTAAKAAWALVAAGAYTAAAYIILSMIIEMIVYAVLFRLFVKVVGVKVAFIVAIIAAIAGVSSSIDAGSIEGAPFAAELLTASSGISAAVGKQLQSEIGDLLAEYSDWQKQMKEQTKLLDAGKELLEGNLHLSPFVIFGEKPDDFYNRTVHAGNIGVVSLDVVSSFVDVKLSLPKLVDTLGVEGVQT